jgi:GDP-L-fucose synthase
MMKVLITGGSGFIGRNLVEALSPCYAVAAPASAELNLLDETAVRDYLCAHRFDVIVHTATVRSNRRSPNPLDMLDRNCRMFFNLARNEGRFGKLIHLGSGAQYHRGGLPSRVREEYFDTRVPTDPYGFSKYICAKYIERAEHMVELRLFGVFGKYEAWDVRFISNACCRVLKGLPITLRQDVIFDYLYADDLAKIVAWFIEHEPRQKAYNVCRGQGIALSELAALVAAISGRNPRIMIKSPGLAPEYTGDNSRLLSEMGDYEFRDMRGCIEELYSWYSGHPEIFDIESLQFDN